jgi:hypothetical protein
MFKTVCVHLEMGELRRARFRDVYAAGATLTPPSLIKSPAYTADDLATSSTAATPGSKKSPWVNVPPWSPLHRRLEQRSDKPLDNLTVDALHPGTDSSRSPSTELEPAPKDSEAPVTERHEEDDHGDDGNTPSHLC